VRAPAVIAAVVVAILVLAVAGWTFQGARWALTR
jgi:hypothetical protein